MWQEYTSLEEDTVDVLFVGTSHVYSAIDPMYMYENSGITSFAISAGAMRFDLTYTVLQEALETQSPKVIFLDMSAVHYSHQVEEARIHPILDQLRLSSYKLDFILNSGCEELTLLDSVIPFFRYHSRWSELNAADFRYTTGDLEMTYTRGHYISYKTVPTEFHFYDDVEETHGEFSDYLSIPIQKIAALCEEKDIDLILFKIPLPGWYEYQSEVASELADLVGVPYLELYYEKDEIGLDAATDYRDDSDHLNQYGAEKLADYLIEYLDSNYDLSDQRGINQRWDEDAVLYDQLKEETLQASLYPQTDPEAAPEEDSVD
ncbi:MAG: hypothetical protein LUI13_06860 [Lachnospiraceae bacterium]|nr:hypothetical protein [Lachnospiraceae bacterium]